MVHHHYLPSFTAILGSCLLATTPLAAAAPTAPTSPTATPTTTPSATPGATATTGTPTSTSPVTTAIPPRTPRSDLYHNYHRELTALPPTPGEQPTYRFDLPTQLPATTHALDIHIIVSDATEPGDIALVTNSGHTTIGRFDTEEPVTVNTLVAPPNSNTIDLRLTAPATVQVILNGVYLQAAGLQLRGGTPIDVRQTSSATTHTASLTVHNVSEGQAGAPMGWAVMELIAFSAPEAGTVRTQDGATVLSFPARKSITQHIWVPTNPQGKVELNLTAAATLKASLVAWVPQASPWESGHNVTFTSATDDTYTAVVKTPEGWRFSPGALVAARTGNPPADLAAVVANITVIPHGISGTFSVGHQHQPRFASNQKLPALTHHNGHYRAETPTTFTTTIGLDALGEFDIHTSSNTDIIIDIVAAQPTAPPTPHTVELPTIITKRAETLDNSDRLTVAPFGTVTIPAPANTTAAGQCELTVAGQRNPIKGTYANNAWQFTMGGVNMAGDITCTWTSLIDLPITQEFTTVSRFLLGSAGKENITVTPRPVNSHRIDEASPLAAQPGTRITLIGDHEGMFKATTNAQLGYAHPTQPAEFIAEPGYTPISTVELDINVSDDGRALAFTMPDTTTLRNSVNLVGILPNLLVLHTTSSATTPSYTLAITVTP